MNAVAELAELIASRETIYRFLARLYRVEVDRPLFDELKSMGFPTDCPDPELAEGYRQLTEYLRHPGSADPLTDLAVDYARVFLAAGVHEGVSAVPYESIYTSEERIIMQDARDQVKAIYLAKGLGLEEQLDIYEDHLALEIEFLIRLCHEAQVAATQGDAAALHASLSEQKAFLSQHIANWVPAFCDDILKCSSTAFYKALAHITRGFLRMDQSILEDLIAESAEAAQSK